jgi:hypothetical protein
LSCHTESMICYQTQWMKDMVGKSGDPNDHEVLPWAASDVTYGLVRTTPDGDKWYTMISWFINIRVGSAHPGFITHMKGVHQDMYHQHYKAMVEYNPDIAWPRGHELQGQFKIHFMEDFHGAQSLGLQLAAGELVMIVDGCPVTSQGAVMAGVDVMNKKKTRKKKNEKKAQLLSAGEYIELLMKGCEFHWVQSTVSVRKYPSMVPLAKRELWDAYTKTLRETTSSVVYEKYKRKILKDFPKTRSWLTWWTRPKIAKMIFKSQMAKALLESDLDTNNHAESGNRDLKRCLVLNLPIAAAAAELFKYCKNAEREYINVRTGRVNPKASKYRGLKVKYPSDKCPDKGPS